MNQTDVRTFKAATMQEALDIVRREMGPDAVILHTRELAQPRFLVWRRSHQKVEITAGTGVNVRTPRALLQPPAPPSPGTSRTAATAQSNSERRTAERSSGERHDVERQRHGETPSRGGFTQEQLAPPPALLPERNTQKSRLDAGGMFARTAPRPAPSADQAARLDQRCAESLSPSESGRSASVRSESAASESGRADAERQAGIAQQLKSIQAMVEKLSRGAASRGDEIPGELFQLYTELIDSEVEEDLARSMICRLKQDSSPEVLGHAPAAKRRLCELVEAEIRCARPIAATPGRRKVVALVGPTGVGKTTTIAKLAANFRLRDGIRMGLVTVDTYRIAAVEQLRTYAEIIDLPMKVVTGPREMRRALDELMGLDLVLIDTAGRSPRDELQIQELKTLLAEAQVDEVHLVLSLVASARSLQATAEKFAAAGSTSLILTKLDEAVGMGGLMSVARNIPLPISYITTGQDVPDDIEHAAARRIARLVLGEESLFAKRAMTSFSGESDA